MQQRLDKKFYKHESVTLLHNIYKLGKISQWYTKISLAFPIIFH